jgi:hypothetical protein
LQAQDYLESLDYVIFDEIWFTDLRSRPIQIWPNFK